MMKQYIYIGFGLLAVGLGVLGVVVPERRHLPAAETAVYPSSRRKYAGSREQIKENERNMPFIQKKIIIFAVLKERMIYRNGLIIS